MDHKKLDQMLQAMHRGVFTEQEIASTVFHFLVFLKVELECDARDALRDLPVSVLEKVSAMVDEDTRDSFWQWVSKVAKQNITDKSGSEPPEKLT